MNIGRATLQEKRGDVSFTERGGKKKRRERDRSLTIKGKGVGGWESGREGAVKEKMTGSADIRKEEQTGKGPEWLAATGKWKDVWREGNSKG